MKKILILCTTVFLCFPALSQNLLPSQKAVKIKAVWLLTSQPCNGVGGNAMQDYKHGAMIRKSNIIELNKLGLNYEVPFVPNVEETVVKLYLDDTSRGVTDHYILIADQDLEPPFGAVLITELPEYMANHKDAFNAVEISQSDNAGKAFSGTIQRTYKSKYGQTIEMITPQRVGTHCFPTSTYQLLPKDSTQQTVGISRFFLAKRNLIEISFIVVTPKNTELHDQIDYARKEMDRYWAGLTIPL